MKELSRSYLLKIFSHVRFGSCGFVVNIFSLFFDKKSFTMLYLSRRKRDKNQTIANFEAVLKIEPNNIEARDNLIRIMEW